MHIQREESYFASYMTSLGGHYKSIRVPTQEAILGKIEDEFLNNPMLVSSALFKNTQDGESIILQTFDRDDF